MLTNMDVFSTSCSATMNTNNSQGFFKRRTNSQFTSSQKNGGPSGNGVSECSFMGSGGCFEKLGELLGVSSFSSDREAINEQSLLSSQENATHKIRKSYSADLCEKVQNKEKLDIAGNSPKTLLTYLSKFSYKPSGEPKKTESSPESYEGKEKGLCENSSFIITNQTDAEKKSNEISNPMFESALDECEAAFDISFDDDYKELFDYKIEEKATNDSKNPPTKGRSSDENISDGPLEKFPVGENSKRIVDDSSNVKKYSQKSEKIDGQCNKLINNSICSSIRQNDWTGKKNKDIRQGTLQSSNRKCRKSVPEVSTPTAMTQLLLSPGNIISNETTIQRYCSSPVERQSKPPLVLQNWSPNLSSPIVRSCDVRSSENSVGKIRKRKFPGPAGMLPDIPPGTDLSVLKKTLFTNMNISSNCSYEKEICSQETCEHFEKPPWQNMLKDLATHADPSLLKRFNIRLALCKASKKRLPKHIVFPVMCVLLSDLTFNSNEADAVFKDETGEIAGKVGVEVIEKYKEYMVPFSAIIINRAEFLCNHLIVKLENVAAIYSANGKNLRLEGTSSENIKMLENSNSLSKKNIQRPEHQNPDINIDDDYESFFADDMDDLLNSMDDDTSKMNL